MSDTNVTNNADKSVTLPRLATFGGVVSEKAERTVETIQRKDLRFRILNALTAAVFTYPWILFFRAIKLMDMNRITWVDFLIMIIFLLTCFGFAANSRKTGRSFSGYLIYPYVLAILMPVLVYLGRLLPRVGSGLIREGLGGAIKSALRMNKGLFSQAGFFFIFFPGSFDSTGRSLFIGTLVYKASVLFAASGTLPDSAHFRRGDNPEDCTFPGPD